MVRDDTDLSEGDLLEEVGLDDLFGQGGTSPTVSKGIQSPMARWLLGRLFLSVAGAAVIYGLLYFLGLYISFALLVVTIFVVAALKHVLALVTTDRLPVEVTGRGIVPSRYDGSGVRTITQENDGVGIAVGRWAGRLSLSGNTGRGQETLATWLGDLADERLRLRHGYTRTSDPQRAREMMGEPLWRMLQNPSAGGPTPRDMAVLVKRIGEL